MNPPEGERLLRNIARLGDEELLRLLDSPDGEYTTEALACAQAEMERRGGRERVAERVPCGVPPTPKATAAPEGIGGWLILPLVGLCVGMGSGVINVIQLATAFHAHPQPRIGFLLLLFVVLLLFSAFVCYLFVGKHRWTPAAYIALLLTNAFAAGFYSPTGLARGVVACAIWIPYFATSTRVKRTFVA